MGKISREELERIAAKGKGRDTEYIKVGMSSCGIAAGADEVLAVLMDEAKKRNLTIAIEKCGCLGMCSVEPLVEVKVEGLPSVIYGKVDKELAVKIIEKHVAGKMLVNDHIFDFKVKEQ